MDSRVIITTRERIHLNNLNLAKSCVRSIRNFCFHMALLPANITRLKRIKKRISTKYANSDSVNVFFILQYPEMWNSVKTVYKAFINDRRFNTSILTVPKQLGVEKKRGLFCDDNEASFFCEGCGLQYIDTYPNKKWLDISILNPDIIFIQRPYDQYMPAHLSMRQLSSSSLLCYIPYGYEFVSNIHLEIEYNMYFLNSVFCCFAENIDTYNYIRSIRNIDIRLGLRKVFNLGYPRFDLIKINNKNAELRKYVLWTPRWSISNHNDKTGFFIYLEVILDFFERNPGLHLIIRPHPLMFKNFMETGVMTQSEIDTISERINKTPNINWDSNKDYLRTFEKCDILVSDFSSLIIEFFATNKPVLYCGSTDGFNSIGLEMAKGLYLIHNSDELIKTITFLTNNEDVFFDDNKKTIRKYIKNRVNIGEKIKKKIIDTYCLS